MPQFLRANIKINEAMFHFLDNIVSEIYLIALSEYYLIQFSNNSCIKKKKKLISFLKNLKKDYYL